MIDTPTVLQSTPTLKAYIPLRVPTAQIKEFMHPGIIELFGAIAAQGIQPAGPWFTYHLHRPSDFFDLEISVPVARPVTPVGRVLPGNLPSFKVARTVYHGGYEGLAQAWGELTAWIKANGHKPAGHLWECYVTGPESGPDPSKWRTELNQPLLD